MVEVDFKRVGSGFLRHARERTDEEIFLPHRAPLPLRLLEAYKLARIVSDNEHDGDILLRLCVERHERLQRKGHLLVDGVIVVARGGNAKMHHPVRDDLLCYLQSNID